MKTSIVVPVFEQAKALPSLLRALALTAKRAGNPEILFVDGGSTDGTPERLEAARLPGARVLREPRHGLAEPLNRGVAEAKGELLLFLQAVPEPGWASAMEQALLTADLAVGNTSPQAAGKPGPFTRAAAQLFAGHSERTAHARGHALPWGSARNLGARRSLLEKTGPFSPEATRAADIDWCWRAMLQGARIAYAENARAKLALTGERRALLAEFEGYGLGEAWLHRTYSFLLEPEDRSPDPLLSAVDAFLRIRHQGGAQAKAIARALEEIACAFSAGVRLGYERPHRDCPIERAAPEGPLSWWNDASAKAMTVFVPTKGLAVLSGRQLTLWKALKAGSDDAQLVALFRKLFKADERSARHGVAEFRESLRA